MTIVFASGRFARMLSTTRSIPSARHFKALPLPAPRCHDHKLDPIPTSDYYGLYGVLTSSRMVMRNAGLPAVNDAAKQRLRELKPLIRSELAKNWIEEAGLIPQYLM